MPIPQNLLASAISALPDDTLLAMARHNGVAAELPRAQIIESLSRNGLYLCSYSNHMSEIDLLKVAKVFGIDANNPGRGGVSYAVWSFIFDFDKNQARLDFHRKTGVPKLHADTLREELRKIAKPCIHLTRNAADGPFAGIWGGPGIVPAPAGEPAARPPKAVGPKYRHWITLDCNRLPDEFAPLDLRGAASIYSDEWCGWTTERSLDEEGCVMINPNCMFYESPEISVRVGDEVQFRADGEGTPLFAKPGMSYPSCFQLIDFATPPIRDWLARMGYTFHKNDYSSLPAKELKDVFDAVNFDLNPIWNKDCDIVAVVGGWTIDVEFAYAPLLGDTCYQLVFTLEDSEPWIQAFIHKNTGKHYVRQLIT